MKTLKMHEFQDYSVLSETNIQPTAAHSCYALLTATCCSLASYLYRLSFSAT